MLLSLDSESKVQVSKVVHAFLVLASTLAFANQCTGYSEMCLLE